MTDKIIENFKRAFADIDERLAKGPPAIRTQNANRLEFLAPYFDGMLEFDLRDFSEDAQQYIAAFSYIPVVIFGSNTKLPRAEQRTLGCMYPALQDTPLRLPELRYNLSQPYKSIAALRETSDSHYTRRLLRRDYETLLNAIGKNRIEVREPFNSLQLVSFCRRPIDFMKPVIASAERMMTDIVLKVEALNASQKTEEEVTRIIGDQTGISARNATSSDLAILWGIPQRLGNFDNEHDRTLAEIYFEALGRFGHMDDRSFHNAVDKMCFERGVAGINTPGAVPAVMKRILSIPYYDDLRARTKQKRESPNRDLVKAAIVGPKNISSVDTRHADVRQIIKETSRGTGERDSSSLNHSALYRHPKVPSALKGPKKDQRDPT